jgi:hypothetical protein
MATHTLAATNSPQIRASLYLSTSAEQILWKFTLVLSHNITTFQLKCMPKSSAHGSPKTVQQIPNIIVLNKPYNIYSERNLNNSQFGSELPSWELKMEKYDKKTFWKVSGRLDFKRLSSIWLSNLSNPQDVVGLLKLCIYKRWINFHFSAGGKGPEEQ